MLYNFFISLQLYQYQSSKVMKYRASGLLVVIPQKCDILPIATDTISV